MVGIKLKQITAEEFFNSPLSGDRYEIVDGEVVAKVSPKRVHASLQMALLFLLREWAKPRGELLPEWAITLQCRSHAWVPVPDITYVSFERAPDLAEDGPCPIPADLVIEIISPGQTFGQLAAKASDFITAGVLRVWVVNGKEKTITVFTPDAVPVSYRGDRLMEDPLFPELTVTAAEVFREAGLG